MNQYHVKYLDLHTGGNNIVNVNSGHVGEEQNALIELQEWIHFVKI